MLTDGVSPTQGHESIASHVTASVPSIHSSRPILFSQYRGPHIYNMAETEEEKKKREDEEKQSNFKKVKEKAEREEEARKKAEAERDALLKEKATREEADRKAADAKLLQEKKFEELAAQKDTEAKAKEAEAAKEKARADSAEAKVKAFEDQQEAELKAILELLPKDKLPPLDPADPISKRLAHAKYAQGLLSSGKKGQVGAGVKNDPKGTDRRTELREKSKKVPLSPEEAMELVELSGD